MPDSTSENAPRLRPMIESWEQAGLVSSDLAAKVLTAQPAKPVAERHPSSWHRRSELIGYVGAMPFGIAGLLLATSQSGIGSIFLIGVLIALASPRAVRAASAQRPRYIPLVSRPALPRHRAVPDPAPGPKTHRFVLDGRYAPKGSATTLISNGNR